MKISTLQQDVHAALAASEWVTQAGFTVLDEGSATEGGNNAYLSAKEAALDNTGFLIVVLSVGGQNTTTTSGGNRGTGVTQIGVLLVARSDAAFAAVGSRIEETIRTAMTLCGRSLQSFDFARLEDVGGDRGYVVTFDILTTVSA